MKAKTEKTGSPSGSSGEPATSEKEKKAATAGGNTQKPLARKDGAFFNEPDFDDIEIID